MRYVHRNALDLPGVTAVEEYRWSSHRAYLGHRQPVPWLDTERVLGWFGGPDDFHRFVADDWTLDEPRRVDIATTCDSIDFLLGADSNAAGRLNGGDVRATRLRVADMLGVDDPALLQDLLGCATEASLRNAKHRARRRLEEQPGLSEIARRALALARAISSGV